MLEHHRQARTHALQLLGIGGLHGAVFVRDQFELFIVEQDLARMRLLEQVDATQESTLARATGTDDADHIASLGCQGHPLEHFMTAVAFMQVLDFKFVHAVSSH
ncbi:hypothetical protein D3C76_1385920 [compost metagenome]